MSELANSESIEAAFGARRMNPLRIAFLLLCLFLTVAAVQAKKKPPPAPLDLNSATPQELELLPGVGASTAQAIVDFRTKSGRFQRVEDLLAIRGVSQHKLDGLRPYVKVDPAAAAAPAAPKSFGLSTPVKTPAPVKSSAADSDACD